MLAPAIGPVAHLSDHVIFLKDNLLAKLTQLVPTVWVLSPERAP